ncbi:MAG: hypothetical protein ACFFDN_04360 [Candidatus Hodarchaeota archaeon]
MLYTAKVSDLKRIKKKMKIYYLIPNYGNDEVIPDKSDMDYYKNEKITWRGFILNYSQILMRTEAMEWMQKVSTEAVYEDVVLVDEENNVEYSYRKLLADRMKNMFTGYLDFKYGGELFK